jgi:hypothetical protein
MFRHEDTGARNQPVELLAAARLAQAFEKEVHKLVAELKTSHTGFRHAGMRNIPARHAINATLQRIVLPIGSQYVQDRLPGTRF